MWWWLAFFAIGLLCLATGYRLGRRVRRKAASSTEAEANVIWCYRNILNREPESRRMVRQWAEMNAPLRELARGFIASDEFKRQHPDEKRRARNAYARLPEASRTLPDTLRAAADGRD